MAETNQKENCCIDDFTEADLQDLVTDKGSVRTNSKSLRCQRCLSVILLPGKGELVFKEIFLPHMKKKSENQSPTDGETLKRYWLVDDMFTFENVGFSNTIGTTKYLICADCEIGPVGWHDLSDKKAYYIALDRVEHQS